MTTRAPAPPETFVIRIYRRGMDESDEPHGTVERPDGHVQATFRDTAELAAILRRPSRFLRRGMGAREGDT